MHHPVLCRFVVNCSSRSSRAMKQKCHRHSATRFSFRNRLRNSLKAFATCLLRPYRTVEAARLVNFTPVLALSSFRMIVAMTLKSTTLRICILRFNPVEHYFAPSITMHRCSGGSVATVEEPTTVAQAQFGLGTTAVPSIQWWNDFTQWRNWGTSGTSERELCPVFESTDAMHAFNDAGQLLVDRLREELNSAPQDTATSAVQILVDDFVPLYSSIEVGDGWWHVRDTVYGFVVPIQHLPVSDALKSRLQTWRFQKTQRMLKSDSDRCQLHAECHDLEEHILWELNVRSNVDSRAAAQNTTTDGTTAVESVSSRVCLPLASDALIENEIKVHSARTE